MSIEELVQDLKSLSESDLQEVATYIAFLKFRVQRTLPSPNNDEAYIAQTHIPVWTLESYRRLGWTEAQLLATFPTLQAVDLVRAWAYVADNRDEIEEALRAQEEASGL